LNCDLIASAFREKVEISGEVIEKKQVMLCADLIKSTLGGGVAQDIPTVLGSGDTIRVRWFFDTQEDTKSGVIRFVSSLK